jgi:hypothetical protein
MAHTGKIGLDYFPFDVDFFADEKIEFLSARFGLKGESIAIRILCKIYRNGYFLQWGEDESLLFAKRVGDGVQHTLVNEVVYELVKRGLFNEGIFNRFGILTSKGIQSRFIEASERRKKIDILKEYLLIDLEFMQNVNIISLNVDINTKNVDINPQSKVKKKEIKVKESKRECDTHAPDFPEILNIFLKEGLTEGDARKFYLYYQSFDWKTKDGFPIKYWAKKAEKWAIEEKEKISAKKEKNEKFSKNNAEKHDRNIGNTAEGREQFIIDHANGMHNEVEQDISKFL